MSKNLHEITDLSVSEWSLPLVAPFRVATRTSHTAHNVLVKLTDCSGVVGIGAAAPVEYITGESQATVIAALAELSGMIVGRPLDRLFPLTNWLEQMLPNQPSARAAIEMAVYDLWAKKWNIPLWQYFGGVRSDLVTDITIPIVAADEARALAVDASELGFNVFKIKIGDSDGHEADLARIAAVAETAPYSFLRIDANQAFEPDAAITFVEAAQRISSKIQLVEQPVQKENVTGLKYVKDNIALPVFADESARTYNQVKRLIELDAVDGINIKLMKSSITESVDIAKLCQRSGIKLMAGCMLESPLGIAAAASIAAGIGGFDYIDLDSYKLLKPVKQLTGGFATSGPHIVLHTTEPGWGLHLNLA